MAPTDCNLDNLRVKISNVIDYNRESKMRIRESILIVVDRIMVLRDIRILIPRTCEYVTLTCYITKENLPM